MTIEDEIVQKLFFKRLASHIEYPGIHFNILVRAGLFFLQLSCDSNCTQTGEPYKWTSRKWFLSEHMTDSEFVQTCFKAVLTAVEHEAREQFKFWGEPVLRPHFDVYRLHELSCDEGIDTRPYVGSLRSN